MTLLAPAAMASLVSCLVCMMLVRHARSNWLDEPSHRSLHSSPVPRLGGVGMMTGMLAGGLVGVDQLQSLSWPCLLAALLVWVVGVIDDLKSLRPITRMVCQILASILLVANLHVPDAVAVGQLWLGWMLAMMLFLWGINLFNFMDGIDGLAGTMTLVGFGSLALVCLLQGKPDLALIGVLPTAAAAGFLVWNRPPARLFMGDGGSTLMGLLMVVFPLIGWREGVFRWWMPLLVFAPFWLDASVTLTRRLLKGEKVWQAHRQHYYQRWVLAGYSHGQVTAGYGLFMLAGSGTVLVWQVSGATYNENVICSGWLVIYSTALAVSEVALRMKPQQ